MDIFLLVSWPFIFIVLFTGAIVTLCFIITYIIRCSAHKTPNAKKGLIVCIIIWAIIIILLFFTTLRCIGICQQIAESFHAHNSKSTTSAQALSLYFDYLS